MSLLSVVQFTALLTTPGLLQPITGSRPASSLATISADTCRPIGFRGEVEHGQAWQRELGGGLVFRLAPSVDAVLPGWTIEIRSHDLAEPENELTWVVTPTGSWPPRAKELVSSGSPMRASGTPRTGEDGSSDSTSRSPSASPDRLRAQLNPGFRPGLQLGSHRG